MFGRPRRSERGVALIITVIMLSVITFLAVAFLALSGREKGSVKTATDQTTARLGADTAMVRAQADLLAAILASGNPANFDLLVSTNYLNWNGFDTAALPDPDRFTNVNYFLPNGNPVTGNNALQNLANLFYNPRPPVFITNRQAPNSMEFRWYLDLNRNGRPDLTGFWGVTNNLNQAIVLSNQFVSNYVVGDPQWIGATERIELPHSGTNKFVYRFAYAAVPVGKTLDVNYVHNQALAGGAMSIDGLDFFRNQGVGSWEINLAGFLYDLNTNWWGGAYNYDPIPPASPTVGNAFADAGAIYRYRLNGNPNNVTYNPPSVNDLYGAGPGLDYVDGYTDNGLPLSTNGLGQPASALLTDNDNVTRPWAGAKHPFHFFTTQDLFDPAKTERNVAPIEFTDRLRFASTNASTYDQYTYYRLLAQLGTDSAPDSGDKIHLNYRNVNGNQPTEFVRWTPLELFTNAANRLLAEYTQEWLDADYNNYTNHFRTNQAFGISAIPVMISNRFIYSPGVHRLLQVAANIADTKTDTLWPTVYRPIFNKDDGGLYIAGYQAVPTNGVNAYFTPPMEAAAVPDGNGQFVNVYGVPWVVGAKKGLPNFNELSMHSLFQITRKLQITRPAVNAPKSSWQTNMMYVVGTSNAIGVEAWNSYSKDFTNPVIVRVSGDVTMVLTNEFGIPLAISGPLSNAFPLLWTTTNALAKWTGYGTRPEPQKSSFLTFVTNIAFLPESAYRVSTRTFTTNLNIPFETTVGFPQLRWGLVASARLRFIMQLNDVNGPVLDYVQLDNLDTYRDLSEEIRDADLATGFDGLWSTNMVRAGSNLPQGLQNQIDISLGNYGADSTQWRNYTYQSQNVPAEIDFFRQFFRLSPLFGSNIRANTNLVQQVPFTPTRRVLQEFSWQANDPLVHYLAGDLLDISRTNNVEKPLLAQPLQLLKNIGVINNRYSPWGGNPVNQSDDDLNRFNVAVKDPGIGRSDGWDFPTNEFANLGALGRVHRGTPWQTVYMKSSDLNIPNAFGPLQPNSWAGAFPNESVRWLEWSANTTHWSTNFNDFSDAFFSRPATDRLLFDVFTTAVNENASRGQLSVNQTNLAAWSAVFSGVVVLTNSTSTNLLASGRAATYEPIVIPPAGIYDAFDTNTWPSVVKLVAGINAERSRTNLAGGYVHPGGWFQSAGDLLSVPELTDASPFLSLQTNSWSFQRGVNDAAYEWLPQQIMSLVRLGEPRFVIYAYGQALRPAENSIVTAAGAFSGMCTNYQITAEVAARAVVRVEGSANPADANNPNPKRKYPPRLVVESYNYLPPE